MASPTPTPQQNLNALSPDVAAALARARTLARQNLDLTLAHLPEEMKALKHWILWRYEVERNQRDEHKLTKVPYIAQLDRPRRAATNRPEEWRSLEVALAVLKQDWAHKHGGVYDGLGFCFLSSSFSGCDLDDVIRDGRMVAPWAETLLAEFRDTYSEISVGGQGLHVIVRGTFTGGGKKEKFGNGAGGFEFYPDQMGRYFAVSGKPWNDAPSVIADYNCQSLADRYDRGEIGPPRPQLKPQQQKLNPHNYKVEGQAFDVVGFVRRHTIPLLKPPQPWRGGTRYIIPCHGSHENHERDDGRAFITQHASGAVSYGCQSESCSHYKELGNHWEWLREHYEPKVTNSRNSENETEAEQPTTAEINWQDLLLLGKKNKPLACLANVITALSYAEEWHQLLAFNEFTLKVVTRRPTPWEKPVGSDWTDIDSSRTAAWLQQTTGILANSKTVTEAVGVVARNQSFHPVGDYLDGLTWDGIDRLPTLFTKYFGANGDSVLLAEIARMYLVSAVARIKQPGCQVDHLLVLQGLQGIYKSQGLRALFSSEWFTDQIPSLDSKDASLQLRGKWGIEFAEFDRLSRHETSTVKAYVTRTIDRFRPVFGTIPIDVPRECVFAATVNAEEFLVDDENRRFWTVHCQYVDVQGILRDRDQFWAEGNARFERGEHWHPEDAAIRRALLREQEQRKIENPYQERIRKWLELPATVNSIALDERWLATSEILAGLEVPIAQWKSVEQYVSKAMRSLGYEKQRVGNRAARFWVLKEEEKS